MEYLNLNLGIECFVQLGSCHLCQYVACLVEYMSLHYFLLDGVCTRFRFVKVV
jgi:hypothetical protein